MLRKFLIPTVIVSILLLLTTLAFITITEATSVTTSTKTKTDTKTTATEKATSKTSATALKEFTETSAVNKFLNNAEETTTSLLPLQPPLNVTSTTLASFILNQKHRQQQWQQQKQRQHKQRQERQRQQQQRQQQQRQQQTRHRHVQVVKETQQFQEHLLNDNANDNKGIKKKNLDHAFVTVTSPVAIITPEPTSTHAYIPFDLDYSDPTEEKAARQQHSRQSTINEVLTNLFPKGFSDIFRFSYADNPETTSTTTKPPSITVVRSTPTPFKPMPTTKPKEERKQNVSSTIQTKTTTAKPKVEEPSKNMTLITVSTTVTKETRREVSPGHTEIVVEKIITDPNSYNSSEEFRDGSNSISRDELLRINRAAREASVLPSLLIKPQDNCSTNGTKHKANEPIVILNESDDSIDDFVDAPEDDNQIAETQNVVHQVYQKPPPAESTSFHATQNHQYNVRIIHDDNLRKAQDEELERLESQAQGHAPSYQSFVQQSKYLQNSLQEAPSRKFLKNFQHPILSQDPNPAPVSKGNFHYEHNGAQSHIQTVPPAAQLQYMQYQQQQQPKQQQQQEQEQYQHLHTQIIDSQQLRDKDVYQTVDSENQEPQSATPGNIVFVTINTPAPPTPQTPKQSYAHSHESLTIPSKNLKSPHEFVSEAIGLRPSQLLDHQTEETENNPKPSNGGYTFVEVQKSINIHNKLITEKDGHLIEQHETIYPEHKYRDRFEPQSIQPEQQHPKQLDYVSLSQNPIHVEQMEEQIHHESYEPAASLKEEQHVINPSQDLAEIGPIQQSNLIQESHIIETANQGEVEHQNNYDQGVESHPEEHVSYTQQIVAQAENHHPEKPLLQGEHHPEEHYHQEEQYHHPEEHHHQQEEHHNLPEPSQDPYQPPVQIPYALPPEEHHHRPQQHQHLHQQPPMVLQEIVEKHIPMPYAVPEPVGVPIHIEHFIDRPYPVETIVEKPVPYPVEKVVEKVVEKHVPVEVQKVVEKEKIVNKYIDRPVAIPIKIPVALHIPNPHGHSLYGHSSPYHPSSYGGSDYVTPDFATPWSQGGGTLSRIPAKVLQSYYTKMLKKLVPQMQQAYKNSALASKPKTSKPYSKQKISDILFDLKPPPARPRSSKWDLGARYQYDYNTLPLDLSASSSMDVGKQYERPGKGYKTNFDEFQRWRNGHNLKRSPDFGRNLHMEYGFKPPLVPSVEIDDKGVPLKAVADLTKGKEE